MTRKNFKTAVALPLIALLAVGVGACGNSKKADTPSAPINQTTVQADGSLKDSGVKDNKAPSDSASDISNLKDTKVGGSFSGKAEGKEIKMDAPSVACLEQDGATSIAATQASSDLSQLNAASLVVDADGKAGLVHLRNGDLVLSYIAGGGTGSAELSVDGKNYTVKGEAPVQGAGAESELKSYELKFTCP